MKYKTTFGTRDFLIACLELAAERLNGRSAYEESEEIDTQEAEITTFLMLHLDDAIPRVWEIGRRLDDEGEHYHLAMGGITPLSREIVSHHLSPEDAQAIITEMLLQVDRSPPGTCVWMCLGHNFSDVAANAGLSYGMPVVANRADDLEDSFILP